MHTRKNIFIIGYEDFNAEELKNLPIGSSVDFHPLITFDEIHGTEKIAALDLFNLAIKRLDESSIKPDAIITYWDFPCTLICSMLNSRYGLNGPNPRSVFKCEHKGWSRSEQRKVIADNIPLFQTFDPNDEAAYEKINLLPPYWIKPIKSFQSWLSFQVTDKNDFEAFRKQMKENVDGLYLPFVDLMRQSRISDIITNSPDSCIAESGLTGHMCTIEGYVYDGQVVVYGVVDSIREKNSNSFQRYQYPSMLPMDVQFRMAECSRKVIDQIDLNDSCFNIEYFYDQTSDTINLLEINPRTSQSHANLFANVHGHSQFQIIIEIALNQRPQPMKREGDFRFASKYMHRVHRSGKVVKVPSEQRIREICAEFPGTKIEMLVQEGDELNDLKFQDAYSFLLAQIHLGGNDEVDVDEKYNKIVERLGIIIDHEDAQRTTASDSSRIEEMISDSTNY